MTLEKARARSIIKYLIIAYIYIRDQTVDIAE